MENQSHLTKKREFEWSGTESTPSLHRSQAHLNEVELKLSPSPFKKEKGCL